MILGGSAACIEINLCDTMSTACDYQGLTYVKIYWFRSLATNSIADNTAVAPFI